MTKTKNPAKKNNPNDTTFRNINALKKRVAALALKVKALEKTSRELLGLARRTR